MLLRRGDIVLTNFTPARPGEANFTRPAIVVTNNEANLYSGVVTVVPLTSNVEHLYKHDLFLPMNRSNLDKNSKAQVDLVRHINITRIIKHLSVVPDDLMIELDARLREHLAL